MKPKALRAALETSGMHQSTCSRLARISGGPLSQFINGQVDLSDEAKSALLSVVDFIEELTASQPVPVNFNSPLIDKWFKEYQKMRATSEVINTNVGAR